MWNNMILNPKGVSEALQCRQRSWMLHGLLLWLVLIGGLSSMSAAAESPTPGAKANDNTQAASDEGATVPVIPLEQAYHLALANEEQIKIAGRELAKAQLLPWRAYAQLTPRAEIDGVFTRNKEEISFTAQPTLPGQQGTPSTIRPLESWQGTFVVTQPVIQPAFPPTLQLGKESVRQNIENYDFTI